jgi:hypothetical protein
MTEQHSDTVGVDSMAYAVATARSLLGYSVAGAAETLGIPESIVRDAESGAVEINAELQELFESCYGIQLSTLVSPVAAEKPRTPIAYDVAKGILRIGTLGIRFRLGLDDNDILLRGFSSAIRRQRRKDRRPEHPEEIHQDVTRPGVSPTVPFWGQP